MQRLISLLTAVLVVFVGGAAFALSFDNLRSLALSNGVTPGLVALWPCLLDAFVIACALSVLRGSLSSERTLFAWVLLFAFTGASVTFNVITFDSWLAGAIHGLPALVNFLSIELLTGQVKSSVKRRGASQSLAAMNDAVTRARQELTQLEARADAHDKIMSPVSPDDALAGDNAAVPGARGASAGDNAASPVGRAAFIVAYRANGHKSIASLARELGVDVRTAQRWVKADAG